MHPCVVFRHEGHCAVEGELHQVLKPALVSRTLCELDSRSENPVSVLLSNKELRTVCCIYLPLAEPGGASGEDADCPCLGCLLCEAIGGRDRCLFRHFLQMTYLFHKPRGRSCSERLCTVQGHSDFQGALCVRTPRGYHTYQVSIWLRGLAFKLIADRLLHMNGAHTVTVDTL